MDGYRPRTGRLPILLISVGASMGLLASLYLFWKFLDQGVEGSVVPYFTSYVAQPGFPTEAFSSYYLNPAKPTEEPQPAIYDPVLNNTYPYNLTNPDTIPSTDPDPAYFPEPTANISESAAQAFINAAISNVTTLITGSNLGNCSKCISALEIGKSAALTAPSQVPGAMVDLCKQTGFHSNEICEENFAATNFGQIWTQVLAFANVTGLDGQYICNSIGGFCRMPYTLATDVRHLFPKPKPANAKVPPQSGERVRVAHLSDIHLDPRYAVGSEANCSSGLCCRTNAYNGSPTSKISLPANAYGSFLCDSPYDLTLAALQSIGPLTGTIKGGLSRSQFAWSIYTGDLVSHDPQNQLSRAYTEYTETSVYTMLQRYLTGPLVVALGNHDTNPEAIDAPHSLPGPLGRQLSWNYAHVSALWQNSGWLSATEAAQARTHYGAYSVKIHNGTDWNRGLRIVTLNTDFWYRANYLNFINTTDPDPSGILAFLVAELQAAEDAGERVWIVGHVLSGWDGSNPLPNPTDMFYAIVERYSPHVIANIFWGHTHEDQVLIYYAHNGTVQSSGTALTTAWIGPSITPLTNLNSGFRFYEVDTGDFNIYDAYTYVANVSAFPGLNVSEVGPTFQFEYSTRDTYGPAAGWPGNAPLNATFWHKVTEAMEKKPGLVDTFNTFQGKSSVLSPRCDSKDCRAAKVCFMRSGSVALGRGCVEKFGAFGSVQSSYPPQKKGD